ncbi:hypothetical protein M3Y99_01797600 [Aphelenchoides fujianensis]|nr:hypothetical protein M3Y99_01797600 [Aphelenchoides fujianensis]
MSVEKEEYLRKFRAEVAMFVRHVLLKAGSPRIPVATMKRGFEKFYWRTLEQDLELGGVEEAAFLAAYPQFWRTIERDGTTWLEFVPLPAGDLRRPKVEPMGGEELQEGAEAADFPEEAAVFQSDDEAPVFSSGNEAEVGERPDSPSTGAGGFGEQGVGINEERHAPATPQIPSGVSSAASEAIAPPDPGEFVGFSSSSEDEEADDERVDDAVKDFRLAAPHTPPATPQRSPLNEELEQKRREVQAAIDVALRLRRLTEEHAARFNATDRFAEQKVRALEAERDRLAAENVDLQQQLGAASTKIAVQRNEMASMESLIARLKHHFALLLPGLEQEVAHVRNVLDAVAGPQAEGIFP